MAAKTTARLMDAETAYCDPNAPSKKAPSASASGAPVAAINTMPTNTEPRTDASGIIISDFENERQDRVAGLSAVVVMRSFRWYRARP